MENHNVAKLKRQKPQNRESRDGDEHSLVHEISMLPDEVLVLILCRLTFKQAVATSLLSRRWRYLWTFTTRLDFDGTKLLAKSVFALGNSKLVLKETRLEYVRCVNRVLALLKDSTTPIEFFRVHFDLNKSHERDIDEWVRYALERNVQILELDFTNIASYRCCSDYNSFPIMFPSRDEGDCSNYSQPWSLRHCNSIHFKHLKKLLLNHVDVDGEDVEFFLCNCSLLEHLSVSKSAVLLSLKITGPFPSLRCLEICHCTNLTSVEIRDTNLDCLKYRGGRIHFLLEDVPLLVNLTVEITGMKTKVMNDVVQLFSSILPQLETFKIYAYTIYLWDSEAFYSTVKLSNLKELMVNVSHPNFDSFLPLTNLIHASPFLQRFVLEVKHKCDSVNSSFKLWFKKGKLYAHLKEVMFVAYRGTLDDRELVLHFVNGAVALEKIVIDPCRGSLYGDIWKYNPLNMEKLHEEESKARTRAEEQLREKVPPRINLEILS